MRGLTTNLIYFFFCSFVVFTGIVNVNAQDGMIISYDFNVQDALSIDNTVGDDYDGIPSTAPGPEWESDVKFLDGWSLFLNQGTVDIQDSKSISLDSFAFEFWLKPYLFPRMTHPDFIINNLNLHHLPIIINKGDVAFLDNQVFNFRMEYPGHMYYWYHPVFHITVYNTLTQSNEELVLRGGSRIPINYNTPQPYQPKWLHVACSFDGEFGVATTYLNGFPCMSKFTDYQLVTNTVDNIYLGNKDSNSSDFYESRDKLDQFNFYNRAVKPSEIYQNYFKGDIRAQYLFDECITFPPIWITNDSSMYNNHGTLVGMTCSLQSPGKTGAPNEALAFNGSGYVECNNNFSSLDITEEITIETWLKPDTSSGSKEIVSKVLDESGDPNTKAYKLELVDGKVHFYIADADGSDWNIVLSDENSVLSSSVWYHIVGTYKMYNGYGIGRIYINGIEKVINGSGLLENIGTTGALMKIGTGSEHIIDEITVLSRALTEREIYERYFQGYLVGNWTFDEDEKGGNIASDSSRFCNDGTLLFNMDHESCWIDRVYGDTLESARIGTALKFSSVGFRDFVRIDDTNNSLDCPAGISVEALIRNNLSSSGTQYFVEKNDSYSLRLVDNRIEFEVRLGKNTLIVEEQTIPRDVKWLHVVGTYENGTAKLYLNGDHVDSEFFFSPPPLNLNNNPVTIGKSVNLLIDEVRIFERALNADEVGINFTLFGGDFGFGCEEYQFTSHYQDYQAPIGGGGYRYKGLITKSDCEDYPGDCYVLQDDENTHAQLQAILTGTPYGNIVFIPGTYESSGLPYEIELDFPSPGSLVIPEGVILASNRGERDSPGALLYSNDDVLYNSVTLEKDSRFTGLQLKGPSENAVHATRAIITRPTVDGDENLVEIDNCEIYDWTNVAIWVWPGYDAQIHHNYIHHINKNSGTCSSYGINMHSPASSDKNINATIIANKFANIEHHSLYTRRMNLHLGNYDYKVGYNYFGEYDNNTPFNSNIINIGYSSAHTTSINSVDFHHNTIHYSAVPNNEIWYKITSTSPPYDSDIQNDFKTIILYEGEPENYLWVYNNWLTAGKPVVKYARENIQSDKVKVYDNLFFL